MVKLIKEKGKVSGRTAFDAARAGDEAGAEVVRNYCGYVADGIVSLVNILEPERVCVGGGISKEGEYLLGPVREFVEKYEYNRYCPKTIIETATLFNDAGIIGAALAGAQTEKQ
jgi:glucokinase